MGYPGGEANKEELNIKALGAEGHGAEILSRRDLYIAASKTERPKMFAKSS